MLLALLLSLLGPVIAGAALVSRLWPREGLLAGRAGLRLSLGAGLGLGVSSCAFFLWLLVAGQAGTGIVAVDAVLVLALLAIRRRSSRLADPAGGGPSPAAGVGTRLLPAAFALVLAAALLSFVLAVLRAPHGEWDAWAIWNLRARFLFRGGERWADGFSPLIGWSHPDYPLLLPATVARLWTYAGGETVLAPALVAGLFTFGTAGLLCAALSALRGRTQGLLAGLVLLGTPHFVVRGASQIADVPVGFLFLAATVLFCLHDRAPAGQRGLLVLAGLAAGLAAWTKNEGLLFVVSVVAARGAAVGLSRGWRALAGEVGPVLAGLAPVLLVVAYFKTQVAPPGEWLAPATLSAAVAKLADPGRYAQTLRAFAAESLGFAGWRPGPLPALAAYAACVGVRRGAAGAPALVTAAATPALVLLGYLFVYVVTPYDLGWHLASSLSRLYVQVWPSVVFACFLLLETPEGALGRGPSGGVPGPSDPRRTVCRG